MTATFWFFGGGVIIFEAGFVLLSTQIFSSALIDIESSTSFRLQYFRHG